MALQPLVIVIGGGVVGLAVARAFAKCGSRTLLVERALNVGTETSSRNSGVIHAGLYYKPGSLKSQICRYGYESLTSYAQTKGVRWKTPGQLVVATCKEQIEELHGIRDTASSNGVTNMRFLDADEVRALEPNIDAVAALLSPDTGIIDVPALIDALVDDLQQAGGEILVNTELQSAAVAGEHVCAQLQNVATGESSEHKAHWLINCAGLYAHVVAKRISGLGPSAIPQIRFAKGNYFLPEGEAPFSHLVYPVPENGGLGAHFTPHIDGGAMFGPDVEWLDHADPSRINYAVDPMRKAQFVSDIRKYWPQVGELQEGYSGVRPKSVTDGDFDIRMHGDARGFVNLFGIESPGLTCCLALADVILAAVHPPASPSTELAAASIQRLPLDA